ncbi:hypothetical protein [Methylophaga nitratireducenticrescens]|nr:hypothetical protein [Methylophaga nitratireducenticrescens]
MKEQLERMQKHALDMIDILIMSVMAGVGLGFGGMIGVGLFMAAIS